MESGPKHLLGSGQSLLPQVGFSSGGDVTPLSGLNVASSAGSSSGLNVTPSSGLNVTSGLNGQGAGKVQTTIEWHKGTSNNHGVFDFSLPHSIETPEHLAIICPPATQKLIQEGVYVNLASFIPKEAWEDSTLTGPSLKGP